LVVSTVLPWFASQSGFGDNAFSTRMAIFPLALIPALTGIVMAIERLLPVIGRTDRPTLSWLPPQEFRDPALMGWAMITIALYGYVDFGDPTRLVGYWASLVLIIAMAFLSNGGRDWMRPGP
jgi:hypothetical protein